MSTLALPPWLRPTLLGLLAGVVAYAGANGISRLSGAQSATIAEAVPKTVPSILAPVPSGAKNGAKNLAPSLAPVPSHLAPLLAPSVSPRISSPSPSPSGSPAPNSLASPTPSITPRISTPTPSPTPTPEVSPPEGGETSSPEPSPSDSPAPSSLASVVISEIAWAGTSASYNGEWLELFNAGGEAVDLAGWTLWAEDGSPKITLSGTIPAGGFALLERSSDSTVIDITAQVIYTGFLEDDGEVLVLRDGGGVEWDRVEAWYAGDKTARASMERISPASAGTDPSNWASNDDSVTTGLDAEGQPIRGTPSYPNSVSPAS